MRQSHTTVRMVASKHNWIEGEAVRQLEKTAELPGMRLAVGMPDLHPGRGHPIGAAFLSQGIFYPHLVGNDIGCGMGLWQTELKRRHIRLDRWVRQLSDLDGSWDGDVAAWWRQTSPESVPPEWDIHNPTLGTIGGGNHFAELQTVDDIRHEETFRKLGFDPERLVLLVHSGSRGIGEAILRAHVAEHGAQGLADHTDDAHAYLIEHDRAVQWGIVNRGLIAHRFLSNLRSEGERRLDLAHNTVTRTTQEGKTLWLHRKGATPSDAGAVMIPGSRGAFSYLVEPVGEQAGNAFSLAHGAGRKWNRREAKARLSRYSTPRALTHTALGSRVICEDKALMYEEAPQAYKNIDIVVQDLVDAGLVRMIAVFRPVITYKTRRR